MTVCLPCQTSRHNRCRGTVLVARSEAGLAMGPVPCSCLDCHPAALFDPDGDCTCETDGFCAVCSGARR